MACINLRDKVDAPPFMDRALAKSLGIHKRNIGFANARLHLEDENISFPVLACQRQAHCSTNVKEDIKQLVTRVSPNKKDICQRRIDRKAVLMHPLHLLDQPQIFIVVFGYLASDGFIVWPVPPSMFCCQLMKKDICAKVGCNKCISKVAKTWTHKGHVQEKYKVKEEYMDNHGADKHSKVKHMFDEEMADGGKFCDVEMHEAATHSFQGMFNEVQSENLDENKDIATRAHDGVNDRKGEPDHEVLLDQRDVDKDHPDKDHQDIDKDQKVEVDDDKVLPEKKDRDKDPIIEDPNVNTGGNKVLKEVDPKVDTSVSKELLEKCLPLDDVVYKAQFLGDKDPPIGVDVNEHTPGVDDAPLAKMFCITKKLSQVHVPKTRACKTWDHNEDYGNEYGPPLPTQEELRKMEHHRLVGEATNMMLNFAKDPKLAKYMTEVAFQDVHAQWKATTTSSPKLNSKKQYSEKELEQESTFDKAKKHKKHAEVPSYSSSSSDNSSDSSEEERKGKKRSKKQRHGKGKKKTRKSKSRRVDDSSTEDTSTNSSNSEDGHFYAYKKNFYKANQYDFLEDKSKKVREFKEGGHSIKFDTFSGHKDASKALSFIQQFDIAFAGGHYSEHSKIRRAASHFKGNARTWWSRLLLNKTAPVKWLKFKKLFISSWLTQEYERDIRAAWNHFWMTKRDTVDAYCERFWSAFLPASSFKKISFREQIVRFTLGLPTEIL
ncbi:hypothetical protein L7F22_010957 [Adiantum nelumboides]|nr:hypothetical protein [Adiantum nelumboides]